MLRDKTAENIETRKLAIVTGATSGIGRAYACYFAAQGYNLLITGRRKALISQLAWQLETNYGISAETVIADLTKKNHLNRLLRTISLRDNAEVLINNAGYGLDSSFSSDELSHQMDMMKVHINAPLMLIHAVLPVMIRNKSGIIINVSSLAASMPTAKNGMYTGTKSFIRNFTESLHMDVSGHGIKVQCLCPGFTYSDFHRNSQLNEHVRPIFWMKPSQVVDYSIYCLKKGQVICIPGFLYRVVNRVTTLMPRRLYYPIANRLEKTMNPADHKESALYY
jgi:uncharacterized protein